MLFNLLHDACDYGFLYFFSCSSCARTRSSCFLSSGVNSAPKSSASNTWRISISDSAPGKGLGQRFTHSIASSFDFTCHSQKPAISSLVSAKGPSITVWLRFGSRAGSIRTTNEAGRNRHAARSFFGPSLTPSLPQRKQCAQPGLAQEQPQPDQHAENDRGEESGFADAHVGGG